MSIVIDASVLIKALVREEGSEQAALLVRQAVSAPDLLVAECLNALRKKVLRRDLSEEMALVLVDALQRAPITYESAAPRAARALELSLRLSLSVYDCVYLALAEELDMVLVTADRRFVERCRQSDAVEFGARVRGLDESLVASVRERVFRPYRVRRRAA